MLYLEVTGCKKDVDQNHVYWYSPACGSKGYRKRWRCRGLKYLNLPEDYKWISYHPQDWGIRISYPWSSCYLHMEFRVNHFSFPQLLCSRHSDVQPLLGTIQKKVKHYYSTLFQKAGLPYHQLCWNTDRSITFMLSPWPLLSFHPLVPMVQAITSLDIVMACCYCVGQRRRWNNNKQVQKSLREKVLSKWSAHFQR